MFACRLDHIVVTAPTLAVGVEWVRDRLGATAEQGGTHVTMGTHNCLLRLGDTVYLEIIAPDPGAPKPGRPRWFGLDRLTPDATPRLAAWLVRTRDIKAAMSDSTVGLGHIQPMSRGDLNWLITIPEDGELVLGGVAPMLIEWKTEPHPATRLQDAGIKLIALEGFHADITKVSALLRSIGAGDELKLKRISPNAQPYLVAHVQTASGVKTLGGD